MIQHYANTGRIQSAQQTSSVQSLQQTEAALARGQERLSHAQNGQTIQGKVLSISEGSGSERMAQVDLGGGAIVNARLTGSMALSVGQDISFSIQNANPSAVALRPLYANTAADSSVMKALSQAGLSAGNEMTAMVREMMSEGLPIDRTSLLSMSRSVTAFPGHPVSVVQMTSLGIPVNEANIEQFENYKNFEHQVMHSIDQVMDDLPDAFQAMRDSGNIRGALDLYGELLGLFGDHGESGPAGGQGIEQAARLITEETLTGEEAGADVKAGTASEDLSAGSLRPGSADHRTAVMDSELADHIGRSNAQSGNSGVSNDAGNVLEAAMKALKEAQTPLSQTTSQPAAQNAFPELLRSVGIPEQIIQNLNNGETMSAAQSDLMRALAAAWQKGGHRDVETDAAWTKLFSSKEMNSLIKNAVAKDWLLSPDDVADKENVRNLYDRLHQQTSRLSQALADTQGLGTHLSESVKNLQQNLDFMNDLNHMFQYVQLPLKMNGQNTHGDLYVYANKKNAMHEDGTVSAILHLDMEHMGPVDVYVKMRDNNVKTNFYLADDEMIDFLMDHIDILNKRLEKRGYNMEAKMHLHTDEMTEDPPVGEMLSGNIGSMAMLSHTSFDALA